MQNQPPPRPIFGRASLPFALAHGERGRFWRRGEPQVWLSAAALAGMLLLAAVLLIVIAIHGLGTFWPSAVAEFTLTDGGKLLGEEIRRETNPDDKRISLQLKTGNREYDPQRQDFRWIRQDAIKATSYPDEVYVLERMENGDFYGRFHGVRGPDLTSIRSDATQALERALELVRRKANRELRPIANELFALSGELQANRDRLLRLDYRRTRQGDSQSLDRQRATLNATDRRLKEQSDRLVRRQQLLAADLRGNMAVMSDVSGNERLVPLVDVVRCYRPNAMGPVAKCLHYLKKLGELLWDNPRESNTEGGLFPAIFGTVMLIFIMAIACFPLGVLAGVYLGEYAKDGFLVRLVRIAVNNLAGIPSIVYGIFGLGFFVYGVGGLLDQWLFPERAAVGTPTFGTGGILWASLTLGLLTVPIVIVSTEEALRAIPRATREGSFALGATKFQTLVRVLIPLASPGMMTGFILAMARAAGEVAPLMITGVVKLAPQLPVDGVFPYFHLDRKFMHLGFHIFDVGFQSPNVEASKPMVFVTTLLLLTIVLAMTSVAIYLRNRMRSRYHTRTI
ncbi:MAG: phosphate ABC transporter permease PstA [Planctomycetaceae bacterium]|nr:phosphate ABC transporter permease PstA [Planctomycetaceae bacterium]